MKFVYRFIIFSYKFHRAGWLKGYGFWVVFGRCLVRVSVRTLIILTGFAYHLRASDGTVPYIRPLPLRSTYIH